MNLLKRNVEEAVFQPVRDGVFVGSMRAEVFEKATRGRSAVCTKYSSPGLSLRRRRLTTSVPSSEGDDSRR